MQSFRYITAISCRFHIFQEYLRLVRENLTPLVNLCIRILEAVDQSEPKGQVLAFRSHAARRGFHDQKFLLCAGL
jgi:hypothetical protein